MVIIINWSVSVYHILFTRHINTTIAHNGSYDRLYSCNQEAGRDQ